nr:LOW QUALITY PROTEIN: uncharacterized protein LOC113830377 [Penaeus vannamei]
MLPRCHTPKTQGSKVNHYRLMGVAIGSSFTVVLRINGINGNAKDTATFREIVFGHATYAEFVISQGLVDLCNSQLIRGKLAKPDVDFVLAKMWCESFPELKLIAETFMQMNHVRNGGKYLDYIEGSFFLPKDQQVTRPPGPETTDYEGLAYLGEYPLAWAACLGNETVYNKLIDFGADPNAQDTFGNMILHMVVVCNQLGMFSYALRHPRIPAQDGIMNMAGLTPLTLACKLARSTIFKEMLELTCIEFWRYSNITCSAYPLNALDTIRPSGETSEWGLRTWGPHTHTDIYMCSDPEFRKQLWDNFFGNEVEDISRYCFEAGTLMGVVYVIFQQGEEIMNQGLVSFMRGRQRPQGHLPVLQPPHHDRRVPCRVLYFFRADMDPVFRALEDELMAYAVAGSWFWLMFFAEAQFRFREELGCSDALLILLREVQFTYTAMNFNIYSGMSKFVFLVFTIMLPIMLLNMLIAMMANTYSTVISMSEKEWVKAASCNSDRHRPGRAISQEKAKTYLYMYSLPLGGGVDGGEEALGVMVIKSKDKTKAKQRKGALSNWKRVGRVTIDALHRRGVTGEFLRREMWGLQTAASTPVKGPTKKKGGPGMYGITGMGGGGSGVDIMGDALNQAMFAADMDGDGIPDNGFGAFSGAIDQLAFTHDLDFSGDGVDDDPLKAKPPGGAAPPHGAPGAPGSTLAPPAREKKKKKKPEDGFDNPRLHRRRGAAAGGGAGRPRVRRLRRRRHAGVAPPRAAQDRHPGGDGHGRRRRRCPAGARGPRGRQEAAAAAARRRERPRAAAAAVRQDAARIGSARKTPSRFTMAFDDGFSAQRAKGAKVGDAKGSAAAPPAEGAAGREPKGKADLEADASPPEEDASGEKWASKPRRSSKNKVAPSGSSEESVEAETKDDFDVGLQSGADSTREEVRAKEKKERPKTSVASQKMKKRATDDVGNMNSILPWDNEDGDIK